MYIIAGLGNPDSEYSGTRHNTGFEVVDEIADKYGIRFKRSRHRALCGKGRIEDKDVLLVKPLTYMNLSGESLLSVTSFYKTDIEKELIVIYDDIDLDVGRIRIRKSGSAGGHNGMKNIISLLSTQDFVRIRVGVGAKPEGYDLINWVLGHFSKEDREVMDEAVKRAAKAGVEIIKSGADIAMNRYNS